MRFSIVYVFILTVLCHAFHPAPVWAQDVDIRETVFGYPGSGADVGQFSQMTHDSSGNLHVVYYDALNETLKYALGGLNTITGTITWRIQVVDDTADVGQHCDIAVTKNGRPVISYHDVSNGNLKVAMDRNGDGDFEQDELEFGVDPRTGNREIFLVDDTSAFTGLWTSIAATPDDLVHVAYKDQSKGRLRHATFNFVDGRNWKLETVDESSIDVGRFPKIVIDTNAPDFDPIVFYQDEARLTLKALRKKNGVWEPLLPGPSLGVIDASVDSGGAIDAVVDPVSNQIYMVYQDAQTPTTDETALKLAVINADRTAKSLEFVRTCLPPAFGPCGGQNLDGRFGFHNSIVLDGGGRPQIAHYHATPGDLIIDRRQQPGPAAPGPVEGNWVYKIRTQEGGDVGRYTSSGHHVYTRPTDGRVLDIVQTTFYDASRKALRLAMTLDGRVATPGVDFGPIIAPVATDSVQFATESAIFIDGAKAGLFSSLALATATSSNPMATSSTPLATGAIPFVAFYDDARGSLFMTRRTQSTPGSAWETPMLVDDSTFARNSLGPDRNADNDPTTSINTFSQTGQMVSMVLDANNRAHLAYHDRLRNKLMYAVFDFDLGTVHFTIDSRPMRGQFLSQALSPLGPTYVVAYYQAFDPNFVSRPGEKGLRNGPRLLVAIGNGAGAWTIETVDDEGDVGRFCSVAIDSRGQIHISYFDQDNFTLKYALRRFGGFWETTTLATGGILTGLHTSIAINPIIDEPAIAFYDLTASSLQFAQLINNAWSIVTVDDVGDVGRFPTLGFSAARNRAFILYYDATQGRLKLATKRIQSVPWAVTETIDDEGDVGLRPSMVIDPTGEIRATYYDQGRGDLIFREFTPSFLNKVDGVWTRYR